VGGKSENTLYARLDIKPFMGLYYKTLAAIINSVLQYVGVFVTVVHFQPCIILAGKDRLQDLPLNIRLGQK